jgi:hypothetical protein
MNFRVDIMENLTAYPGYRGDDPGREDECHPTTELVSSHLFATEVAALAFYNHRRALQVFAGTTGMYVTYPRKA